MREIYRIGVLSCYIKVQISSEHHPDTSDQSVNLKGKMIVFQEDEELAFHVDRWYWEKAKIQSNYNKVYYAFHFWTT